MSEAGSLAAEQSTWQPKVNPWIIGVAVSLAAFMEALDTSIANVALPHIAGSMGASSDESTWVLTSYLVSNAVVLPISGFLVGWLGRKRFFLMCVAFFTVRASEQIYSRGGIFRARAWGSVGNIYGIRTMRCSPSVSLPESF
jgi:DHA2 family multidrug resistance protein